MEPLPPTRTVLYVPADNARALAKAPTLGADALIIDLEDAVAPAAKDAARTAAGAFSAGIPYALRLNGTGTPWREGDEALARRLGCPVVLPKVKCAADIADARLEQPVWPMMETAAAILNAGEIAAAASAKGPSVMVLGANDLAAELNLRPPFSPSLVLARQTLVLAARAAGIRVVDAVTNAVTDTAAVEADATAARAMGFHGKSIIHPAQIAPVHAAFAPTAQEIAEARAVIAAVEAAEAEGRGVAVHNGQLVEALHADAARRTLAEAGHG